MTKGSNERPTRRLLTSRYGDYVVELRADLMLIRPKGARRGGKSEVAALPGVVYQRALLQRVDAERRERKKSRRGR
jgi:hypothetical protein